MTRCAKIFIIIVLIFFCGTIFLKFCFSTIKELLNDTENDVDLWLRDNQLYHYRHLFKEKGKN